MRHLIVATLLIAGSLLTVQATVTTLEDVATLGQGSDSSYTLPNAAPSSLQLPLALPTRTAGATKPTY